MNQTKPTNRIIKSLASQMFKGYFAEAVIILIMAELIALVPGKIINFFFSNSVLLSYLSDVYILLIRGPLRFAAAIYFLCNFRNQRVRYNCLMYGFDYFAKSAAIYIFTLILTTAGLVLFIIPGFIAMINFSQALNILVDHPEYQALQCMKCSKDMMRGCRMKYVSFAISYWFPFILSRIPQFILSYPEYSKITFEQLQTNPLALAEVQNKVFSSPWYLLCELAMILLTAYFSMGKAAFYDILSGNLVLVDQMPEESEAEELNSEEIVLQDNNFEDYSEEPESFSETDAPDENDPEQ